MGKELIEEWSGLGGGEMGYQVGRELRDFHKAHIWNIQFSTDQQLPFSNSDWIILCGDAIMLGDLVYSSCLLLTMTGALPREPPRELISDNPWFTSLRPPLFSDTPANQLKVRRLTVPHITLHINSHYFFGKSSFCLAWGLQSPHVPGKRNLSLVGTRWDFDAAVEEGMRRGKACNFPRKPD